MLCTSGDPPSVVECLRILCERNRVEINVLSGSGKVYLWVIPNGFVKGFHVSGDSLLDALQLALRNELSSVGEYHQAKEFIPTEHGYRR